MPTQLNIAIAVQGRFHAFELARALIEKGHAVTLLTNYPRFAVARFGLPTERVRSWALHGVVSKLAHRVGIQNRVKHAEMWLHRGFGQWICNQLRNERWDVVYSWSGVSEEFLSRTAPAGTVRLLARGSAHIEEQSALLQEEEARTGSTQDKPSAWRIQRELREYNLADAVIVLSSFCHDSFVKRGFPQERLRLMVSGTRLGVFAASPEVALSRQARILAHGPLRILNVGTFSYRKGALDIASIARGLPQDRFQLRMIGTVMSEAAALAKELSTRIEFQPRIPQSYLVNEYARADVFLFPTIEDGFPAVMAQAAAGGLPILTTPNGAGRDLVNDGVTGWILPIRSPESFIEKLRLCEQNRPGLAEMANRVVADFKPRDWSAVADDFVGIATGLREGKRAAPRQPLRAIPPSSGAPRQFKVALVVQGRFYAFELMRELLKAGIDAQLFTNYPRWIGRRFGLPPKRMRSHVAHGLITRMLQGMGGAARYEPLIHQWFSRWAAGCLRQEEFSVIKCFSGVAEEVFRESANHNALKIVARGSAHIQTQADLLEAEEQRVHRFLDRPSPWRILREKREYELADLICVLSGFAYRSFQDNGVRERKLMLLPLGSDLAIFRPPEEIVRTRNTRILSGKPLRILTVSNFTVQKGVHDLRKIAQAARGQFEMRLVGAVAPDAAPIINAIRPYAEVLPKVPQSRLPGVYAWADLFVFPTIHDGFAAVLTQAQAGGLPILATTNCAAPDIITEGKTGWILPIRCPEAFLKQLQWCDQHRSELAAMAQHVYRNCRPLDWADVARSFISQVEARLSDFHSAAIRE